MSEKLKSKLILGSIIATGLSYSILKFNYLKSKVKVLEDVLKSDKIIMNKNKIISLESLAILAEHTDMNTGSHLQRIRYYVTCLSNCLSDDYDATYLNELSHASLLHDIGKNTIDAKILNKPDKLNNKEYELIKTHSIQGEKILDKIHKNNIYHRHHDEYIILAKEISRSHHEWWDGSGYPDGLKGEEIPVSARIVALADVYDALVHERLYKSAWSHEKAVEYILNGAGTQFDPNVVEQFKKCEPYFKEISKKIY